MIESTRMQLDWLGRSRRLGPTFEAAAAMQRPLDTALANPATRTRNIAGTADLAEMIEGILAAMDAGKGR